MARPLRIQYPGAVYHVTCRGNERKNIFKGDYDRKMFLYFLERSLITYTVKLYSYVLMNNHFHLLVETPLSNLAEFMRQFNIRYTGYYNRRNERTGHLYQGRYKSILVEKDAYLTVLSLYIHLNPARVKAMVKASIEEKGRIVEQYPWSSLLGYLPQGRRESFIDYGMVLGEYGGDTDKARKSYRSTLHAELANGMEIKDKILGRSIIGRDDFIEEIRVKFIGKEKSREVSAVKQLLKYCSEEDIMRAIKEETGKGLDELKLERGVLRQITMEMLYRFGGLKGEAVGRLFGVGYTAVSQERKRLHQRMQKDVELKVLYSKIEAICEQ